MKAKNSIQITKRDIEKLLNEQTAVILEAVGEKTMKLEKKFDSRMGELITTLDKFLKRLTDIEDEFIIMKSDINRMKKIIKEKLGVEL